MVLGMALGGALQTILTSPDESEEEMARDSLAAIKYCFKQANDKGKWLVFDPGTCAGFPWQDLCNTVAIEDLRVSYFYRCGQQQVQGAPMRGVLFTVLIWQKRDGKVIRLSVSPSNEPQSCALTWLLFFGIDCVRFWRRLLR